jgi:hypothetical protein
MKTKNKKIKGGKIHTHQLNKTKKLKKLNCSPKDKNEINQFSCYTNNSLIKLRDLWNARHPDIKIKTSNPKEIHSLISGYLGDVCNTEACWIKQKDEFGNLSEDFKDSFAPLSPVEWRKNPNEWLSSLDIMKVMKQYEKVFKCFSFIGPTPIDFDTKMLNGECVWDELCNISLQSLIKKGKTKIGIIFNTDPHNKPGEHWISMFINIKKGKIFYFDSVGHSSPKEVKALSNKIIEQGKKLNPPIHFKYDENHPIEHQYGNTECGIYSLFFIVHMLEDKITEHYLKTHIIKDAYVMKFRKIYFNDQF